MDEKLDQIADYMEESYSFKNKNKGWTKTAVGIGITRIKNDASEDEIRKSIIDLSKIYISSILDKEKNLSEKLSSVQIKGIPYKIFIKIEIDYSEQNRKEGWSKKILGSSKSFYIKENNETELLLSNTNKILETNRELYQYIKKLREQN